MFQMAINLTVKQYHPSAAAFISLPHRKENKSNLFNNHPIPNLIALSLGGKSFFQFVFKPMLYLLSLSKHNRPKPSHQVRQSN